MTFTLIKSIQELQPFRKDLEATDVICFDVETTSTDPLDSEVLLLQAWTNDSVYVFDCRSLGKKYSAYVVDLINSTEKITILHNAKFDLEMVKQNLGVMLTNVHCTMITETVITNGIGKKYIALAELTEKYLGVTLDKSEQESFIYMTPEHEFTESQLEYAASDVMYLKAIYQKQLEEIANSNQKKVYSLEMKLLPVMADMELTGVVLDPVAWNSLDNYYAEKAKQLEQDILEYFIDNIAWHKFSNALHALEAASYPKMTKTMKTALEQITQPEAVKVVLMQNLNINSNNQIKALLALDGLVLESVGEEIIKDYKFSHKIIPMILEYRDYTKKVSTYGSDFLKHIHPKTGRVHTDYHQTGGRSGRFSSSKPNLQNIPKESDYRICFKAGAGKVLICADYSQQEYRLAGAISHDPVIIDAYLRGLDMHTATAAQILGKPLEEVTKDERNWAKSINFAVLYGSTEYGLAYNLGIDVEQARVFLHKFFEGYPVLTAFKKAFEQEILSRMYSVTLLGRRRYFQEKDFYAGSIEMTKHRNSIRREGFNHIIQGTAADMTKMAMINAWYNNPFGDKLKIILQVHDELMFECDEEIAESAKTFAEKCMVEAGQFFLVEIPTVVEIKITKEWSK
jgi:DNA polymerase-1